jgi:hypothetical protein
MRNPQCRCSARPWPSPRRVASATRAAECPAPSSSRPYAPCRGLCRMRHRIRMNVGATVAARAAPDHGAHELCSLRRASASRRRCGTRSRRSRWWLRSRTRRQQPEMPTHAFGAIASCSSVRFRSPRTARRTPPIACPSPSAIWTCRSATPASVAIFEQRARRSRASCRARNQMCSVAAVEAFDSNDSLPSGGAFVGVPPEGHDRIARVELLFPCATPPGRANGRGGSVLVRRCQTQTSRRGFLIAPM